MENHTVALVSGFMFGALGAGYVVFGRKAEKPLFLAAGLSLWGIAAVIFFATWVFFGLGIVMCVLPFIWRT